MAFLPCTNVLAIVADLIRNFTLPKLSSSFSRKFKVMFAENRDLKQLPRGRRRERPEVRFHPFTGMRMSGVSFSLVVMSRTEDNGEFCCGQNRKSHGRNRKISNSI